MEEENSAEEEVTHTFNIAGVKHHEMRMCVKDLKVGDLLQLVPEPTNKFDSNAVRIEKTFVDDNYMLGYVPAKFSSEVTAALGVGHDLKCVITKLDPSLPTWEWCEVEIRRSHGNGN